MMMQCSFSFATDSTTDDAEKEVKLDINTQPMK